VGGKGYRQVATTILCFILPPVGRYRIMPATLIADPHMAYKYQQEVQSKARHYIWVLQGSGIQARIIPDSFRDYSVKLSVIKEGTDFGSCSIYYKPKTGTYTLRLQEMRDPGLNQDLETAWHAEEAAATEAGWHIYVDGSFYNNTIGLGAVIIHNGNVVQELSGTVEDDSLTENRNIAGELRAVQKALQWCQGHSVTQVTVYYDYLGIEKWATGTWKAKLPLTQGYARFICSCPVAVTWQKVKGHAGNRWNEQADRLARQGTQQAPAGPGSNAELAAQLQEKSVAYTGFLLARGIRAYMEKIYNEQYARILVREGRHRAAIFDLYHTAQKPFTPYIHSCQDDTLKHKLTMLWSEFHNGQMGF
jgi:ribonuclease HI